MTTKGNNGNNTFIKITNKDIFDKLEALGEEVKGYNEKNEIDHEKMKGRIKMQYWLIGAAMSVACYSIYCLWGFVVG